MATLSTPRPNVERIRRARAEVGMTQAELARQAGVSVVTVGKWERGERCPSGPFLRRLSLATNKPVEWFFAEAA